MAIVFTRKKVSFKRFKDIGVVFGFAVAILAGTIVLRYAIAYFISMPLPKVEESVSKSTRAPNIDWNFLGKINTNYFKDPDNRGLRDYKVGKENPFSKIIKSEE
ncbi:hypothetical protein HRbin34_00014 [bacterium HR34]|nr:hypothetical protein HRbin34_00014 [bacterium HR34]